MRKFIELVHGSTSNAWYQTYPSKNREKKTAASESFKSNVNNELRLRLKTENKKKLNVSVAINRVVGNKRTSARVRSINALFIDSDDGKQSLESLLSLRVVPHVIVETSPNRFHAYWLVKDCKTEQFKALQIALANHFKTDLNICDLARVMRLPGTINWNHEKPFLAHIVHESDSSPVSVTTLVNKLRLVLSQPAKPFEETSKAAIELDARSRTSAVLLVKIRKALSHLNADDRTQWLRAGMAIHSAMPGPDGYDLWTDWSKPCSKFDAVDQNTTWSKFKPNGGMNIGSLYWLASHAKTGGGVFDDMSAAKLYAQTFYEELRYDPQMGSWYEFDGVVWQSDKQAQMRKARQLVAALSEGDGIKDPAIKRFRSAAGMKAIVSLAEYESKLKVTELDFDIDKNLLAVKNGVIDLRFGKFRQAIPKDFLRRCAAVEFNADAKCPQWRNFISQVTCGDKQLAAFLRRIVGYILYGHTKSQAFFVLDGTGENGKGVFMRVLVKLLAAYAKELAPNLITSAYAGNANASTPALIGLKGIRLGIVTELPNSKGFDTAFVKQFSGGDSLTARANYGEQITFKPEGKLLISTNDMPEIAANDKAMWRRIFPIPFKATFSGSSRDDDLEEKLLAELPGILNWALYGARRYYADGGLVTCDAVDEHKRKMRRESDTLAGWIVDCCIKSKDGQLQASKGYASYLQYAKRCGRTHLSQKAFNVRLEKSGYRRLKTNKYNLYSGLDLRPVVDRTS